MENSNELELRSPVEDIRKAKGGGGFSHELPNEGDTNIWLTPKWVTDALGHFDLDPCAAPHPRPWDIATTHYDITAGQDGLLLPWTGRVFCNPPYGPHVGKWMKKMGDHGSGIVLIFARVETRVWQDLIWPFSYGVLFPNKRITFCRPNGTSANSAAAPSALVAFSPEDGEILRTCAIEGIFVQIAERDAED